MSEYTQKSIEHFFQKHGVSDPDRKMKLLPKVTDTVYDYNMLIVELENAKDDHARELIVAEIKELEDKLERSLTSAA